MRSRGATALFVASIRKRAARRAAENRTHAVAWATAAQPASGAFFRRSKALRSPRCSGSASTPSFTSFACMPASTSAQRSDRLFAPQRTARSRSPGPVSGFGNHIRIQHAGFETSYSHLSEIPEAIHPGVDVKQGDIIALSGNTGLSTGPHLHFEFYLNRDAVDPLPHLGSEMQTAAASLKGPIIATTAAASAAASKRHGERDRRLSGDQGLSRRRDRQPDELVRGACPTTTSATTRSATLARPPPAIPSVQANAGLEETSCETLR